MGLRWFNFRIFLRFTNLHLSHFLWKIRKLKNIFVFQKLNRHLSRVLFFAPGIYQQENVPSSKKRYIWRYPTFFLSRMREVITWCRLCDKVPLFLSRNNVLNCKIDQISTAQEVLVTHWHHRPTRTCFVQNLFSKLFWDVHDDGCPTWCSCSTWSKAFEACRGLYYCL